MVSQILNFTSKNKSPVMSTGCMGLADYPPLFALLKANNSLRKVYIVTFQIVVPVGWNKVEKFPRARLLETNTAHMRCVNHNTIA